MLGAAAGAYVGKKSLEKAGNISRARKEQSADRRTSRRKYESTLSDNEFKNYYEKNERRRKTRNRYLGSAALIGTGVLLGGVTLAGNVAENNHTQVAAQEGGASQLVEVSIPDDVEVLGFKTVKYNPGAERTFDRPLMLPDGRLTLSYESLTVDTVFKFIPPDMSDSSQVDVSDDTVTVTLPEESIYTEQHIDPEILKNYHTDGDWLSDMGNAWNDIERSFSDLDQQIDNGSIQAEDAIKGILSSYVELNAANTAAQECGDEIKNGSGKELLASVIADKLVELNRDTLGDKNVEVVFEGSGDQTDTHDVIPYRSKYDVQNVNTEDVGISVNAGHIQSSCEMSQEMKEFIEGGAR